ncbi:MAG: hypothetical protein HQK65_18485 [Desulfamplus sp.]|nr:hypothetical protein [Desulfamplus sp.]
MKSIIMIMLSALLMLGCTTKYPNQNPVGKAFPSVSGTALEGVKVNIPEEFEGRKVILLLGYVQDTQFDIDRWLIGLDQTQVKTNVYEIPTINSFWAGLFREKIDEGMRRGIPKELWKVVITVYDDGAKVQEFTGNESPRNARVLLLDEEGAIIFFYDRGFSVPALNELRQAL